MTETKRACGAPNPAPGGQTDRAIALISALRPPAVLDEAELQAMIAGALASGGVEFAREARIGPGCRADFLLPCGAVVEVKARRRTHRQLMEQLGRYAACPCVSELVLVTSAPVRLPERVCGKPLRALDTRRLWGIAL